VLLLALNQLATATSLPPAWVGSLGQQITTWTTGNADDGIDSVNLNFNFPFEGELYSTAYVSSNGCITLGGAPAGNDSQPIANSSELVSGPPRIALAWYDIDARDSGSIWINNSIPGEVIVTWEGAGSYAPPPGSSVAPSNLATFQVVLNQNGQVILSYETFSTVNAGLPNSIAGSAAALIGVSNGGGVSDPGPVNISQLTSASPYLTSSATVYSVLGNSGPGTNLSGTGLQFTPQNGGWSVLAQTADITPAATPEPATILCALSGMAALIVRVRQPKR
jgi:hypothetical protein